MTTTYEVSLSEGTTCKAAGLPVEYFGSVALVTTTDAKQRDTFWATRLAFLRANPSS